MRGGPKVGNGALTTKPFGYSGITAVCSLQAHRPCSLSMNGG